MRCPMPMMRRPAFSSASSQAAARCGSPIASSMSSTGPGAPPCSGPLSAPIAPVMALTRSDPVECLQARGAERGRRTAVQRGPDVFEDARELLDIVAGDHETAGLTTDVAQLRASDHHPLKTVFQCACHAPFVTLSTS